MWTGGAGNWWLLYLPSQSQYTEYPGISSPFKNMLLYSWKESNEWKSKVSLKRSSNRANFLTPWYPPAEWRGYDCHFVERYKNSFRCTTPKDWNIVNHNYIFSVANKLPWLQFYTGTWIIKHTYSKSSVFVFYYVPHSDTMSPWYRIVSIMLCPKLITNST